VEFSVKSRALLLLGILNKEDLFLSIIDENGQNSSKIKNPHKKMLFHAKITESGKNFFRSKEKLIATAGNCRQIIIWRATLTKNPLKTDISVIKINTIK